jgi:hypothetical protein
MRYQAAWMQQGRGLFGALVLLALSAGGVYYVYRAFGVEDNKPDCAALLTGCMQRCRATTAENDATESCERKCEDGNRSCVTQQAGGR